MRGGRLKKVVADQVDHLLEAYIVQQFLKTLGGEISHLLNER